MKYLHITMKNQVSVLEQVYTGNNYLIHAKNPKHKNGRVLGNGMQGTLPIKLPHYGNIKARKNNNSLTVIQMIDRMYKSVYMKNGI